LFQDLINEPYFLVLSFASFSVILMLLLPREAGHFVRYRWTRSANSCLSYYWAIEKQLTTTRETLEAMTRGILTRQLAQTILDSRLLGPRYLWVDTLCIIQDSDEEKSSKIERMGLIDKGSIVAMAARDRQDCTKPQGCLLRGSG
jgi:hypothetical protein